LGAPGQILPMLVRGGIWLNKEGAVCGEDLIRMLGHLHRAQLNAPVAGTALAIGR